MSYVKIVQLMPLPNDATYQGAVWGLGSDGVTYEYKRGGWAAIIPNLDNHDQLTARVSELEEALESMLNLNVKLIESHNKTNPPWESIDMEHCQDADRLLNKNKG